MFENTIAAKERHQRFVERVVLSRVVWGLKDTQMWASAVSTAEVTRGREVIPFWSDRLAADRCVTQDWANHQPTEIPLDLFIQLWLPRMKIERCLAGTNWNPQHSGQEIEPDALRDQLARQSGH
jgi:hypothetical protein